MTDNPSLYERFGGAKAVREAVDRLYLLIFNDDELVAYFEGRNLPLLKSHMTALLTNALSGPQEYAGRELMAVHQPLGISEDHFVRFANDMIGVLTNMGADGEVLTAVSLVLARGQERIVRREGASDGYELKEHGEHLGVACSVYTST